MLPLLSEEVKIPPLVLRPKPLLSDCEDVGPPPPPPLPLLESIGEIISFFTGKWESVTISEGCDHNFHLTIALT